MAWSSQCICSCNRWPAPLCQKMSSSCFGRSCSVPYVLLKTSSKSCSYTAYNCWRNCLSLLWWVGAFCGFLPRFVQFWEGPWSIAPLYSQSFLFPAIDLGHCQTVAWQRAAYISFHVETRTVGWPFFLTSFSLHFFPFSFLVCCCDLN